MCVIRHKIIIIILNKYCSFIDGGKWDVFFTQHDNKNMKKVKIEAKNIQIKIYYLRWCLLSVLDLKVFMNICFCQIIQVVHGCHCINVFSMKSNNHISDEAKYVTLWTMKILIIRWINNYLSTSLLFQFTGKRVWVALKIYSMN